MTDDRPRPPSHRRVRRDHLRALAVVVFAVVLVAETGTSAVLAVRADRDPGRVGTDRSGTPDAAVLGWVPLG